MVPIAILIHVSGVGCHEASVMMVGGEVAKQFMTES